jgi:Zn-dependent protease with chaperone function
MTLSLLLLCAAASAVIAFSTSAMVGAGLAAFRHKWVALTPAAEARVLLGAALLPMLTCVATMAAALAPSFGWIVDHCAPISDGHLHPHICMAHHVSGIPAGTVMIVAGLFLVRLWTSWARLLRGTIAASLAGRALAKMAFDGGQDGLQVLPFDAPQAFVLGAWRPSVFITRGLISEAHREHLATVLSHERAHIRRRDPLRRAVAAFALAFHIPGLARWLERCMARAHEMAADADAARETGSREGVARALVRLTRAHQQMPRMVMAFGDSDVEARVATLLDHRPRQDRPHRAVLLAGVAVLFIIVGTSADAVHHGVEIVLGLLSG